MKTNKSEMIRVAIRAAGEPITARQISNSTGIAYDRCHALTSQMVGSGMLFVAGTAATKVTGLGQGFRPAVNTYELAEFGVIYANA